MTEVQRNTITINNKVYDVESLSIRVKQLIGIYQSWQTDLTKASTEVAKLQAALRDLTREIIQAQIEDEAKASAEAAVSSESDPVTLN